MSESTNPQATYLRSLGFRDAADALEAAEALVPREPSGRSAELVDNEPTAPVGMPNGVLASPEARASMAREQARVAEGAVMLAALKRDIPGVGE